MRLLKRRLLSGSAWAFGGKVMTALSVLAANALLARLLSPQDLGVYFLAFSVVSIGALLGSLGLNQAVVRFVAEGMSLSWFGQTRRVVAIVFSLGTLGTLGVGFAYLLFGHVVGSELFHAPALAAVTGLVAGWMMLVSLQTLLAEAFRGFHDIRLATLFNGLVTWVLLVACLSLLWLLKSDATLATVIVLATGSGFASALVAGWLLHRKVASLPQGEAGRSQIGVGQVMQVAWPLLVTNLALFAIIQADLWIVGAFRPQEEVAVYGAAVRLMTLVAMPLVIVNAVVPPLIAEMYAEGKREELERLLRTTATLAGLPAFLVLVGFVLLGGPLLGLIYGAYYSAGAVVLALLSLGQLVNAWAGSCGMTLVMTGHQRTMMNITAASGIVTIAAGIGVVEPYGITGVAVAAAAGLTLQNVLMWLMARRKTGIWTHASVRYTIANLGKGA
jgi:O-antigen/teichoic acid export membrane protein